MNEGMTCYERDEALCEDGMCVRTGCRLRNARLSTDRQVKALADCPFCGGSRLKQGGDDKFVGVACLDCEATGPNHYRTGCDWNTRSRTPSAPDVAMMEALESIARTTFSGSEMGDEYQRGNEDAHATCARIARAALSASEAKAGEPVAWQYRVMFDEGHARGKEWCEWRDAGKKYFDKVNSEIAAGATRVQTRALYDHAPPPPQVDREAVARLVGIVRALLKYTNPTNVAEDHSQQWQAVDHECDRILSLLAPTAPAQEGE